MDIQLALVSNCVLFIIHGVIKVRVNNANIYYLSFVYTSGRQAAEQNNQPLAISYYREAIRLNPTYAQAMNNLANLLRTESPVEAERLFKSAVQYE